MDLYNIPNDDGKRYRLKKFVEYQHEVPSIHYRVLGEYIKKYIPDKDDAVMMCWYMSCTYNEVTCFLLQEIIDWRELRKTEAQTYFRDTWDEWKDRLDFGSARKYAKNMDWFPELMYQFLNITKKKPYNWLKQFDVGTPEENYLALQKALLKIEYVGRFAADLFLESVSYLSDYLSIGFREPFKLDWKNCSNLTSGLLNIFYKDEEANLYDKTKTLPVPEQELVTYLKRVQKEIQKTYPEQESDINKFIGKICSFRNLFKSARYGGFHHDRELGVLVEYEKTVPEYKKLWKRVYALRDEMFDDRFLGEKNNWTGIRKERKKLWLKEGLTGVEKSDC